MAELVLVEDGIVEPDEELLLDDELEDDDGLLLGEVDEEDGGGVSVQSFWHDSTVRFGDVS